MVRIHILQPLESWLKVSRKSLKLQMVGSNPPSPSNLKGIMKTLVLNSSHEFLGLMDYRGAVCAVYVGKALVLEEYDRILHSPSTSMNVPAVIILKHYVKVAYEKLIYVSYTKRNVHLRDNYTCQYCAEKKTNVKRFGIDHVLPRSRGGEDTWTNTVSACKTCNDEKDCRTPQEAGMTLLRKPSRPRGFIEILRIKVGEIHDLWIRYL